MKLTFLGTRGEVDTRTRRHRRHASLLVEYRGGRVMVDCGSQILDGDERTIGATIRRWGDERGVAARLAYDGLEEVLR